MPVLADIIEFEATNPKTTEGALPTPSIASDGGSRLSLGISKLS
jgi:hypothetical protein